jgi:hypothetical protein
MPSRHPARRTFPHSSRSSGVREPIDDVQELFHPMYPLAGAKARNMFRARSLSRTASAAHGEDCLRCPLGNAARRDLERAPLLVRRPISTATGCPCCPSSGGCAPIGKKGGCRSDTPGGRGSSNCGRRRKALRRARVSICRSRIRAVGGGRLMSGLSKPKKNGPARGPSDLRKSECQIF